MDKCTAIVLSAGKGKRMGTDRAKQYLDLCGKPVLYYCLKAFQESFIDEIIIVASGGDHAFIMEEIVKKNGITKVTSIVEGGAERYDSVLCGLRAAGGCRYIFIHDGARPFIDNDILDRAYETVKKYGTAIVSVPSKDTVKIVDGEGITIDTPDRKTVWLMQTPQVFAYEPIHEAYERMSRYKEEILTDFSDASKPAGSHTLSRMSRYKEEILTDFSDASKPAGSHTLSRMSRYKEEILADFSDVSKPTALMPLRGMSGITDDAMVMERFGNLPVHVSEGSYRNIKITTPEDMIIAEAFIKSCFFDQSVI